jgi:photosystem II stability/assembly factor-like uncharacterized protein
MIFRKSAVLIVLLMLTSMNALAQWKNVAPNAITITTNSYGRYGAIHFHNGVIWAGGENLVFSEDTGQTWKTSPWGFGSIHDISFLNKDTGVIASDVGISKTQDGGKTWFPLYFPQTNSVFDRVAYDRSTSAIYALGWSTDTLMASFNGGSSWNKFSVGANNSSFTISIDGTIYLLSAAGNQTTVAGGQLFASSDGGRNWQQRLGQFDGDSYSIDVDSCDPQRLYIANENHNWIGDGLSKIYLSTDGGTTWNATFSHPRLYMAGSFTGSANARMAATIGNGVLRSVDRGVTWKNIGGPNNLIDSRNLCAVNDSIIFAVDPSGNIYATFNGGGDTVHTFSISPDSLFTTDTLCGSSATQSVMFQHSGCLPLSVDHWSFAGPDSLSYSVASSSYDSLVITFASQHQGTQHAALLLALTDGTTDTITLSGTGSPSYPLSMATADQKTDTVGGTVAVPITISGLARAENVELVLHYQGNIDYIGSVDKLGDTVDITGEQWPGRSKLRIQGVLPGSAAADALFSVFADSSGSPQVSFDSVTVLTSISPCEYVAHAAVTSIITPPSGCGIPLISQVLQGKVPTLSVRPNPTTGEVSVETSVDLSDATIEIYDMLGAIRMSMKATLTENVPLHLILPDGEGMYYLRVRSQSGELGSRVILQR